MNDDILIGQPVMPLPGFPRLSKARPLLPRMARGDFLEGHTHRFMPTASQGITIAKWATATLVNGDNIVALPAATHIFLVGSGLTSDPAVAGLIGGIDGRMVTLHNLTGRRIILKHESTTPLPQYRISSRFSRHHSILTANLIYRGRGVNRWLVLEYTPWDIVTQSHTEANNLVTITAGAGEVYANLIWAPSVEVPDNVIATFYASGSARLTSGAPAALHIAYHYGGNAYRSLNIYTDNVSVISVSHIRVVQGPATVTPELVGVTAPGGPNATFERRSLSVLVVFQQ